MHASSSSMLVRRTAQCWACSSNTLASTSTFQPPHHITIRHAASKGKAAPPKAKTAAGAFNKKGKKGMAGMETGGERIEALKQHLYGSDATARRSHELERLEALTKAIPDAEVHETITRAWQLHQRKQREQRSSEMEERYACMLKALDELEKASPFLFEEAVQKHKFNTVKYTQGEAGKKASVEGRIPGLFPRQMPVLRQ